MDGPRQLFQQLEIEPGVISLIAFAKLLDGAEGHDIGVVRHEKHLFPGHVVVEDLPASQQHAASLGAGDAYHRLQQRGLSRSVVADDRQDAGGPQP
jgi:hypothetical protein